MMRKNTIDFNNIPGSVQRTKFSYQLLNLMAEPFASIVTPFYNTGSIFHETARSVLGQSLQQWEWLIINDGSTDRESLAILDWYQRHYYPRIKVVHRNENKGLSAARNLGVKLAKTDYILQLDSDDLLEPTALEKWLCFLQSHPQSAFVNGYSVGFGAKEYLSNKGFHNGSDFLKANPIEPTSLVRRVVYDATGGYDETNRQGLEDWEFWLQSAAAGYWGVTIPEYLQWYRRRPCHTDRWVNLLPQHQEEFHRQLRNKYPHLWWQPFPDISLESKELANYSTEHRQEWPLKPGANILHKNPSHWLIIVDSLTHAYKENLALFQILTAARNCTISIVSTSFDEKPNIVAEFSTLTPDTFVLNNFLRVNDYPNFLDYLIHSRRPAAVVLANSPLSSWKEVFNNKNILVKRAGSFVNQAQENLLAGSGLEILEIIGFTRRFDMSSQSVSSTNMGLRLRGRVLCNR